MLIKISEDRKNKDAKLSGSFHMSVELRPFSVACNIRCHYCYQNKERAEAPLQESYDIEAMKAALMRKGKRFTLFGGEPLLVPEQDLDNLWSWGLKRYGGSNMQTNGTLINESHIRMFKQYRVNVGISIDGPGELNDIRWAGDLETTRTATARTEAVIERLCMEKIPPGLIVTLHRKNATGKRLETLTRWLRQLAELGVRSVRLHVLEVDHPGVRKIYALSETENSEALLHFAGIEHEFCGMKFDLFGDIRRLLRGQDSQVACVWNACDAYNTRAVDGIEGNGQSSNCGRTNKVGVGFVKSTSHSYERYMALYHTPQENGGCSGCRYFVMCKGQCPGTALEGDWRNRSEYCLVWKRLFEHFEREMIHSGDKDLVTDAERVCVERAMMQGWSRGQNISMQSVLAGRCSLAPPND